MESIVFVLLPISILLIIGIVLLVFFDVAFARRLAPATASCRPHRLPLLSGDALRSWACTEARHVVAKYAQRPGRAADSITLAHEIEELASQVIEESLQRHSGDGKEKCVQRSRLMIPVTVPETLALVDSLRRRLSWHEVKKVREQATSNAQRLAQGDQQPQAAVELPLCPLRSDSGCCVSYESRPIYCRGSCPHCETSGRLAADDKVETDAEFAAAVGEGVTAGLTQGLAAAGWDGQLYELNSALARGLELPDAAARCARGEAAFASCRPI